MCRFYCQQLVQAGQIITIVPSCQPLKYRAVCCSASSSTYCFTAGVVFLWKLINGTFWAILRRVKMPWTFLLDSANDFASKIVVKLPSKKKVPWHRRGPAWARGSNCHFCPKNAFFGQKKAFFQKDHFVEKWSVTQNTIFQCIKNIFLLYNLKLVFFTEFNLLISYHGISCNLVL